MTIAVVTWLMLLPLWPMLLPLYNLYCGRCNNHTVLADGITKYMMADVIAKHVMADVFTICDRWNSHLNVMG